MSILNVEHLTVHAGEILGVAGLVGSGRSEIARCIFGADKPDTMELYIDGKEVKIKSVIDAVNHGIGYVTEDRKLDGLALKLDVNYNINLAHLRYLEKGGVLNDKAGRENSERFKKSLNIRTPSIRETVGNLSGGNQQKIVLAKWLSNDIDIFMAVNPCFEL